MDKKEHISEIIKNIEINERRIVDEKNKALPPMYLFLGLGFGLIFNLYGNILHERGLELFGTIYENIVLLVTTVSLVLIYYYLKKYHVIPVDQLEDKRKVLIEELKKETLR